MNFQQQLKTTLHTHLLNAGRIDEHFPECIDVEELWPAIEKAYMPDGIREFNNYPVVSLAWPMFLGMAMAKLWDTDWETYGKLSGEQIYKQLRDARGYDNLDDYILEDVLKLSPEEVERSSDVVATCAQIVYHDLLKSSAPATAEALENYRTSIHTLYIMGMAMELKALGYHMTKMQ